MEAQEIRLKEEASPCSQRPYTISPAKQVIMEEKISDLVKKGLLEPCVSDWVAPSLLVFKYETQGDFHLVTDFRKLNQATIPDVYPLPHIDDILTRVRGNPI